jgi:hypothetical protein
MLLQDRRAFGHWEQNHLDNDKIFKTSPTRTWFHCLDRRVWAISAETDYYPLKNESTWRLYCLEVTIVRKLIPAAVAWRIGVKGGPAANKPAAEAVEGLLYMAGFNDPARSGGSR